MKNHLLLFVFLLATSAVMAQSKTDKEKAHQLLQQGVSKVDSGMFKEGIDLLKEAQKLDKDNSEYSYEVSYALYVQQKYDDAISLLKDLITKKDATDQYYQLLGNSYDDIKKSDKAMDIYNEGIKRFPNSGKICLEKGILLMEKEKYDDAINSWEKGVIAEPSFPSNYYWLGKIFSYSNERIWSVLYGEMFMNLERNTKRTKEMSKILYDTYKKSFHIDSDTSGGVSFSKEMVINVDKKFKIPFNSQFEMVMTLSSIFIFGEKKKEIGLEDLSTIRSNFVGNWFTKDNAKNYPNIVFEYQKSIKEKGFMESYSHWLLMKGDEDAFDAWYKNNKEVYDTFAVWFNDNPLLVDKKHFFVKTQYD